ncbi:MAG: hypothetical protein U0L76_01070 [Ruminococcus sp.]|nr:hypothetical protein [Ruminococcus sp.]
MSAQILTNDEKKRITLERQKAVRKAWKEEVRRVRSGTSTRKWSSSEKKELLERGSVSGYEGHHMKSVRDYPQFAGDSKNIQFLTESEHLYGAHQGKFHNKTNGYYNPSTKEMENFKGNKHPEAPIYDLKSGERIFKSNNQNSKNQNKGFKSKMKSYKANRGLDSTHKSHANNHGKTRDNSNGMST